MKKVFLVILFVFSVIAAISQNVIVSQEYLYNRSAISPALTGYYNNPNASLTYRSSWLGIQGAPEYLKLNYDMMLPLDLGLGVSLKNYKAGIFSDLDAAVGTSISIDVARDHFIDFGFNIQYQRSSVNVYKAQSHDLSDPVLKEAALAVNGHKINSSFGLVYNWQDLYAGFNVSNLFKQPLKIGAYTYPVYREVEFFSTYRYSEFRDWDLDGFLFISKIKETKVNYELALQTTYNKNIWFGLNWRRPYNFGIGAGGKLTESIYFHYNFVLSGQRGLINSAGSHELTLGYTQKKSGWLQDKRKSSSKLIDKIRSLYKWVF